MTYDMLLEYIQLCLKLAEKKIELAQLEPHLHNDYAMGILEGRKSALDDILAHVEDVVDGAAFRENTEENG